MDRIELRQLTRTYYDAQGEIFCALDHVSLIWEEGNSIAIMGENGSGKSTLARLMIELECPPEERVLINGEDTSRWGLREWRKYRAKIQAVCLDTGTLSPAWSTSKNIEEALTNLTDVSPVQRKQHMDELMEQTGLRKELLDTPVRRLSGGEQRRLALLRSLSISPAFLLLDEVTAGLDLISTEEVLQLLEKYKHEHNCVYLVITHDVQIASRFCEAIYEIEHGKITEKPFDNHKIKERNKMKRTKRVLRIVLAAAMCMGLLAGCGGTLANSETPDSTSATETSEKVLNIATIGETSTLSPLYMIADNRLTQKLLYEWLAKYVDGEIEPVLAENWELRWYAVDFLPPTGRHFPRWGAVQCRSCDCQHRILACQSLFRVFAPLVFRH